MKTLINIETNGYELPDMGKVASEKKREIVFEVFLASKRADLHLLEINRNGDEVKIIANASNQRRIAQSIMYKEGEQLMGNKIIDKEAELAKLFKSLGLHNEYQELKKLQMSVDRKALEKKEAEKKLNFLDSLNVISDFNNHILLAVDKDYNSVWAYLARCKKFGTVSFHIYLRKANGKVFNSKVIERKEVEGVSNKVYSILENFDADFTEKDKMKAAQILWIVKKVADYSKINDDFINYSVDEVFMELKKWIIEHIEKEVRKKENDTAFKPVYFEQVYEEWRIGIWIDDLEYVFKELDMGTDFSTWKKEAVIHGYIKRGEGRLATTIKDKVCAKYNRKKITERVLLFNMTDEELEKAKAAKDEAEKKKKNEEVAQDGNK